jgi:hypothetical protein
LLHDAAPATLNLPATQMAAAGVALIEPAGHAYPALQLLHAAAPDTLNVPAPHINTVPLVAPAAGHAKPAVQLAQLTAPDVEYRPATHICAAGVEFVEPARHA